MAELHTMAAIMIKMKLQVFIIGELGAFWFLQSKANNSGGLEKLLSVHCGCVVPTLYLAVISQLM